MLKKIWKDLGQLSRFQFACKYIFSAAAIFFSWGALGNGYLTMLKENDLVKNTGIVEKIDLIEETSPGPRFTAYHHSPLKIKFFGKGNFKLRDAFDSLFSNLQNKIKVNDTITILNRNELQTWIGFGTRGDIYQIEKNGELILPLSKISTYNAYQAIWFTGFAVPCWIIFILYRKKVIANNK